MLAGLVFILDQVAHKFSTSIERLISNVRNFITGKVKRRSRIIILFAVVALPVMVISLMVWGTNDEITWFTIIGVLIFTAIGLYAYGFLLLIIGKRTLRGDISHHINSLIQDGKMLAVNVKVFLISCASIAGLLLVSIYVSPRLTNLILEILLGFIIYPCLVFFSFGWIFSFLFLLGEGLLRLIKRMEKVRSGYYWIAIVVLWVAGGGLLIANALGR